MAETDVIAQQRTVLMTIDTLLFSLVKSYFVVGVICLAMMPRARQLIATALSRAGLRHAPTWAYVIFCLGVVASTALIWPRILQRAYVTPVQVPPLRH